MFEPDVTDVNGIGAIGGLGLEPAGGAIPLTGTNDPLTGGMSPETLMVPTLGAENEAATVWPLDSVANGPPLDEDDGPIEGSPSSVDPLMGLVANGQGEPSISGLMDEAVENVHSSLQEFAAGPDLREKLRGENGGSEATQDATPDWLTGNFGGLPLALNTEQSDVQEQAESQYRTASIGVNPLEDLGTIESRKSFRKKLPNSESNITLPETDYKFRIKDSSEVLIGVRNYNLPSEPLRVTLSEGRGRVIGALSLDGFNDEIMRFESLEPQDYTLTIDYPAGYESDVDIVIHTDKGGEQYAFDLRDITDDRRTIRDYLGTGRDSLDWFKFDLSEPKSLSYAVRYEGSEVINDEVNMHIYEYEGTDFGWKRHYATRLPEWTTNELQGGEIDRLEPGTYYVGLVPSSEFTDTNYELVLNALGDPIYSIPYDVNLPG